VVGIALEGTRGTAESPQYYIDANSADFSDKVEKDTQNKILGTIQSKQDSKIVRKYGEGSIESDLEDKAIGVVLSAVFGQTPSTTGSTNYTHAFTVKESNVHQSLTFLMQDPNVSTKFALGMIDSFELTVDQNARAKYKISFRSKAGVDGSAETASYTSMGTIFLHSDLVFKIAADVASLGAAVALDILGFTLLINKNVKSRPLLGSLEEQEITNDTFEVSGSFIVDYTDQTFRTYMTAGSEKAISAKFGSSNNSLEFVIAKAQFMWEPDAPLDDIVTQKIEFEGLKLAGSDLITAELKNQVVSYEAAGSQS